MAHLSASSGAGLACQAERREGSGERRWADCFARLLREESGSLQRGGNGPALKQRSAGPERAGKGKKERQAHAGE